jgi:hypothetical protein
VERLIELEMIKNIIVMENEAGMCIRFKDTVEYALLKDRLVELESLQKRETPMKITSQKTFDCLYGDLVDCPNCDKTIFLHFNYCNHCGHRLE